MTLREYIKSGASTIEQMAAHLGVSTHAVHKWVYGQRTPPLGTALEIVKASGGQVDLPSLVKAD